MRRWVTRIAIILVASVPALLLAGAGFEEWSRHAARRRFPPPGKMVDVAGAASHLYCTGQGVEVPIFYQWVLRTSS
jgi:hypothetical protein